MAGTDVSKYSMGGNARRDALSANRRKEIAYAAACARWGSQRERPLPKILCGSPEQPLRVECLNLEIACYIIEGERRILVHRGILDLFDITRSRSDDINGPVLALFGAKIFERYVSPNLIMSMTYPIKFRSPNNEMDYGYDANCVDAMCSAILAASGDNVLPNHQVHIAHRCEKLISALSHGGIVSAVDEVTGYKYVVAAQGDPSKQLRLMKMLRRKKS